MPDFAIRFNDFSGGDWGETDPSKVKDNQFSGRNVAVYADGLLGVRPGWKLLDMTGKAVGLPASYTGAVRGFDVMGNKLMIATVDKTYDIYWDLSLAGGTLPANNPIPLPAGLNLTDSVQLFRGADTAMKEFLVGGGKLYYRTGDPTGAWTLTGPSGKNVSIVTRWNLYLVAVDRDQPWIIWFSQVNDSGPNFITWPAANFLYVGTTEPITTLLAIFNILYAGRASGWWGISGVLGVLASVRELAIGNGPLDQRAASVTTDNRIVYWPLQKVPAFWNGDRVSLIAEQRMDPRAQWLNTTPVMARTAPGRGYSGQPWRILMQNHSGHGNGFDYVDTPTLLREIGAPPWTTSPARAADSLTGYGAQQQPIINGAPPSVGATQSYGTRWSFSAAGRVVGVRYRRNNLAASTMTLQAWRDATGTKVAEINDSQGAVTGAFAVTFPTPVTVAAGETYTFGYFVAPNPPVRTDGVLDPVTNTANVTFIENRLNIGGNAYPNTVTTQMVYVEPLFEPVDASYHGSFNATHASVNGTPRSMPPGWSSFSFASIASAAPQAWVATDTGNTAWRTPTAVGSVLVQGYGFGSTNMPSGSALALFVNDVEVARTNVTKPTNFIIVRTEMSFAANDVLSLRFYNPDPVNPYVFLDNIQAGPNYRRPYLRILPRPAEAAAEQMVCPVTGRYDIHVETMTGASFGIGYQILVNRKPIASCTVPHISSNTVDDFTVNPMDANDVALTAGDVVGVGALMDDYSQGWIDRADGAEGTAQPYLRITNRATREIYGTFAIPGDQVVVTPTERRLMLLGDDGATSKIWTYGGGTWTHGYVPMLLAGMAPSDVRSAYQLPEHVVFATKRNYTAEPLKVWSVVHDLGRPALMSDQWASPYDQAAPTDTLVQGQASLAQWFDGQGRQVRVRSVIVNFRKWDQGVAAGTNKITARIDACGPYERGVQPGTEATWEEPMSGASINGTDDSWRFNVGEQGFANGFQVVFTGLYGVAIREVVVTVDVRTERT